MGKKRRFDLGPATSGLPRSRDINRPARLVRFVPDSDVGRTFDLPITKVRQGGATAGCFEQQYVRTERHELRSRSARTAPVPTAPAPLGCRPRDAGHHRTGIDTDAKRELPIAALAFGSRRPP